MTGFWPDGVPIHNRTLEVLLGCGCVFVSKGWRGNPGQIICCDNHLKLTIILTVEETDKEAPQGWWDYGTPSRRKE